MPSLAERFDRFVRWFFNASPDVAYAEPRPVPRERRRGTDDRSGRDRRSPRPAPPEAVR